MTTENEITEVYADGGVIKASRSFVGGSYAWCHLDNTGAYVKTDSGIITPAMAGTESITNNVTELLALCLCLLALPAGWNGHIYSDSYVSLGRLFLGWRLKNVPAWLEQLMRNARAHISEDVSWTLLDGHPTKAQLLTGKGSRGNPVSIHNKWCDTMCTRAASSFSEQTYYTVETIAAMATLSATIDIAAAKFSVDTALCRSVFTEMKALLGILPSPAENDFVQ